MKLLIIFIVLNIVNVIIQTIKSIATVKSGKVVASIVNAIAYGLYTVVVVYMVCELPLWIKVLVVAVANLVGVFIVKLLEEKTRKEKLWKIEVTIPKRFEDKIDISIPHSQIAIDDNYTLFYFYCENSKQTQIVKEFIKKYNGKYFVTEEKTPLD